jgi:hypothetical protein
MKQSVNAFLLVVLTASFVSTFGAIKDDILVLTANKRTKIVWSREVGAVNHPYGIGGTFRLMRFDTDVGTEADVLGNTGAYFRAKITWDGNTIVYDKAADLYAVNFDGTNNRLISTNMALGTLWYDEQTGKQYAVVQVGQGCLTDYATSSSSPMYKVNIADPVDRILIFSGSCNQIWLSISRDGKKLGGSFPWSASGGLWDIAGGTLLNFGQYGCWACTPPDNSYRFAIYPDDTHHGWQVFDADKSNSRFVALNTSPWINGYPTHNARFAVNDPGYVTVNGPFDAGGKDDNSIATGSPNVEITFGKFDAGLTTVTGWARVTNNAVADYMACAWIDQGTSTGTPSLGLSVDSLTFTATKNGANPASQNVAVSNTGGGTLSNVTVTENAPWLTVNRTGTGNGQTLANGIVITGLDTGDFQTTVTVSGGGAANTVSYKVKLRINRAPPQLASITLGADTFFVAPQGTAAASAVLLDQYGADIAAAVTWSVSGGGSMNPAQTSASVNPSSVFTAGGAQGVFTLTATSGTVLGHAYVKVTTDAAPSITVTVPGPSDTAYSVGDSLRVRWTATPPVTGVVVELSLDNGKSFGSLTLGNGIARGDSRWGNFVWKILDTLLLRDGTAAPTPTRQALVHVCKYGDCSIRGQSGIFAINARPNAVGRLPLASHSTIRQPLVLGNRLLLAWDGRSSSHIKVLSTRGSIIAETFLDSRKPFADIMMKNPGVYLLVESQAGVSRYVRFLVVK